MTARKPVDDDDAILAAILASPEGEPLTPEQGIEVSAAEARLAAGERGIPHAEIERQLEARRLAEGG